jgi:hypothetical protein
MIQEVVYATGMNRPAYLADASKIPAKPVYAITQSQSQQPSPTPSPTPAIQPLLDQERAKALVLEYVKATGNGGANVSLFDYFTRDLNFYYGLEHISRDRAEEVNTEYAKT